MSGIAAEGTLTGSLSADMIRLAEVSGLSLVAVTGSYSDLTGAPSVPEALSELTNDSGFITAEQVERYELPVAGAELGGVKNGGNVAVNPDGSMTAAPQTSESVSFTADDPRWSGPDAAGLFSLTVATGRQPAAAMRSASGSSEAVVCGLSRADGAATLTAPGRFAGYLLLV